VLVDEGASFAGADKVENGKRAVLEVHLEVERALGRVGRRLYL
jgi:hypothetical protein